MKALDYTLDGKRYRIVFLDDDADTAEGIPAGAIDMSEPDINEFVAWYDTVKPVGKKGFASYKYVSAVPDAEK